MIVYQLDGQTGQGEYPDVADAVAQLAVDDAKRLRVDRPSRNAARPIVRKAAQELKARLVIEQPMAVAGVEQRVVSERMFRDLRDVYSSALGYELIRHVRRRGDEEAAMAAAEMLLMGE